MSPKIDRMRRKIVYRCDLCPLEFDTREEEIHHLKDVHYGPARFGYECPICHPPKKK